VERSGQGPVYGTTEPICSETFSKNTSSFIIYFHKTEHTKILLWNTSYKASRDIIFILITSLADSYCAHYELQAPPCRQKNKKN
jgi:hypothetical protein